MLASLATEQTKTVETTWISPIINPLFHFKCFLLHALMNTTLVCRTLLVCVAEHYITVHILLRGDGFFQHGGFFISF